MRPADRGTGTASSARPSHATTRGTPVGGATGCPVSATSTSRAVIDVLYEGGFDGTVSVEHEDPVWGGDPDRVRTGLEIAFRTLRPLIVDETTPDHRGGHEDGKRSRIPNRSTC